jgi:hypothetical protein
MVRLVLIDYFGIKFESALTWKENQNIKAVKAACVCYTNIIPTQDSTVTYGII